MKEDNKQEFPGYPHYPGNQDITKARNNNGKEQLPGDEEVSSQPTASENDADITPEDLRILSAIENGSTEDDELLQEAELDETDEDGDPLNEDDSLDIPGSEEDDTDEELGEEDEENNYYSLGGDDHEGQEENNGDQ